MRPERWPPYAALLALGILSLVLRPPLPDDETRYLSVAWSMHLNDAWLVPLLEGQPYSHKPPLLFWLIRLGWLVFGPMEWWPRLLPSLFGCGTMALGAMLARQLWNDLLSEGRKIEDRARWLILGTAGFTLFSTVLLFDVMLACFVLLGLNGLVVARHAKLRGFGLYALALALGGLGKGPVILVYLAPAALLAPVWAGPQGWRGWYLCTAAAVLVGLVLCLAWALPAAAAGGADYANAILWGQTAGRVVEAFAHRRPFWWYLPVLPILCLPWIIWPLWGMRWSKPDAGERLCLLVAGTGFAIFSAISGKQAHYLVPLLPPLVLVLVRRSGSTSLPKVAIGTVGLLAIILVAGRFTLLPRYDLRPAAAVIAQAAAEGRAIGFTGRYEGEITWMARLSTPVSSLDQAALPSWASAHPEGVLIVLHRRAAGDGVGQQPLHRQRYRNRELSIWPAGAAGVLVEQLR